MIPGGPVPRLRRAQLRTRVLAGVLAVTLVALVAFDVAAVTALRGYLVGQTDSQLQNVLSLYRPLEVSRMPAPANGPPACRQAGERRLPPAAARSRQRHRARRAAPCCGQSFHRSAPAHCPASGLVCVAAGPAR